MVYYIEISSWNLLESFVTESISPYSFYKERNYGNNLSRYMSGEKEKTNFLILSTEDMGGEFSIKIDESLIDLKSLEAIPGMKKAFMYPRTIYYKKGLVHFRFSNDQLRDALLAESHILLEVKCLEKYLPDFYIQKKKSINRPTISKLKDSLSFERVSFIRFDNRYNKIKGALIGYVRGIYTTSDNNHIRLQNELRDLKNTFGGLNTQIMTSDIFYENTDIYDKISECRLSYFNIVGEINSFGVLRDLYNEVIRLARMRSEEMLHKKNTYHRKEKLLEEKTLLEDKIMQIEQSCGIHDIRNELKNIKDLEKENGERQGKKRLYFRKGTYEYERKKILKELIKNFEDNNNEYKSYKIRLDSIDEELNVDANKYDNILSVMFTRISDIINNLIKKASNVTNNSSINISDIKITSESIYLDRNQDNPELCYFNILLNYIIDNTMSLQLSEHYVMKILVESAKKFKDNPLAKTLAGESIINTLRGYYSYKDNRVDYFSVPENMPILQSIMSFFIKPLGFDQIERYMLIKHYSQKAYALMLWGAWLGFADIPKTFTNAIYQNDEVNSIIEDHLKELTTYQQH